MAIGGGPAALYFGILMKRADPRHEITIIERNRPSDTLGFGVVFSDETLDKLLDADAQTYHAITRSFAHWNEIEIHWKGETIVSKGHGFSGLSRKTLNGLLTRRCQDLGVETIFQREVTDLAAFEGADLILGSDGANSLVRNLYAEHFRPTIDWRPNRFVWLGTTRPFRAFTFLFKENEAGLFRVHAYRYAEDQSTFIVECNERTWQAAGMDGASEEQTLAYFEALFADELEGHKLLANRSIWRRFPAIKNERWHHRNVALIGDAAHTAHFSIGSGTKLAMEDSIALAAALGEHETVAEALEAYEAVRKPAVEATQRAAQVSCAWFENTERYLGMEATQLAFSLLTRSMRITHDNLRVRDPAMIGAVDEWFAKQAPAQRPGDAGGPTPPPMFTRYKLRDLVLENRIVVSPMCQYSAEDGAVNDWHLVHLGSRAIGGAGLVMAEMTDVSADGRITPQCAGMYQPSHVAAWKRITEFVHRYTPAKIGLQIAHAGRKGATKRMWEGIDEPLPEGGWPLIAASPIPWFPGRSQVPRQMDRADMDRVRADFVRAAEMAVEAGFDVLEVHLAHGYLLASFVSPLTNQRKDEYGGSLAARMRFPLEVVEAVRRVWPAERPLSARISATDWAPGGTTPDESVEIARLLARAGVDVVDVSAGSTVPEGRPEYGRLYQTPFAERIRLEAGVPTMTVGNISSIADVNSILAAGRADLCVLARGHLYDPYWTRHAAQQQGWPVEWPDPYAPAGSFTPR